MTFDQRLGLRILESRQARKMTALQLAALAGVHRNTISRIEAGECQPLLENLWRICRVLGISLDSLFDEPKPAVDVQLTFVWPRRGYGKSKLSGERNRGSVHLPIVRFGMGLQRPGAAGMPSASFQKAHSAAGARVSVQTLTLASERAARAHSAARRYPPAREQMLNVRDRATSA